MRYVKFPDFFGKVHNFWPVPKVLKAISSTDSIFKTKYNRLFEVTQSTRVSVCKTDLCSLCSLLKKDSFKND